MRSTWWLVKLDIQTLRKGNKSAMVAAQRLCCNGRYCGLKTQQLPSQHIALTESPMRKFLIGLLVILCLGALGWW